VTSSSRTSLDSPNPSQPKPFTQRLTDTDIRKLLDQARCGILLGVGSEIDVRFVHDDNTLEVGVGSDSSDDRERDERSGGVTGGTEEEEFGVGVVDEGLFELRRGGAG
jgi:hypothetical protein